MSPQEFSACRLRCWITWGAMLTVQVVLAAVLGAVVAIGNSSLIPPAQPLLPIWIHGAVPLIPVVVLIAAGLFLRGHIFKRFWVGQVVDPRGYFVGNLVAWALCESATLLCLVFGLVTQNLWPLAPACVAMVFFLLLWPDGLAMVPKRGDYDPKPVDRA